MKKMPNIDNTKLALLIWFGTAVMLLQVLPGCGGHKRDTLPSNETSDPVGGLIDHQNAIIQIMRSNLLSDCRVANKEYKKYMLENDEDIKILRKRLDKQKASMSSDEWRKIEIESIGRTVKLLDRYMESITKFLHKCKKDSLPIFTGLAQVNPVASEVFGKLGLPVEDIK
jgi:hypothetical protein